MAAPYGNKNAEKWSMRKATMLFKDALAIIDQKEERKIAGVKVEGYKFDFIGEVARELGTFHEIFEHLTKRFPSLERLKNELHTKIESNCYSNTKKGFIREATGIDNIKSNWKWTDRTENKHTITQQPLFPDVPKNNSNK